MNELRRFNKTEVALTVAVENYAAMNLYKDLGFQKPIT